MRVRVRLFAGTRAAVGASALDMELPTGARVEDVLARACAEHPALARYLGHALLALDGRFVPGTTAVHEGAVVAIMPPVSGGSGLASLATLRSRHQANKRSSHAALTRWLVGLLATVRRGEGGRRS